ncbi:dephospho-CoA kinase [Martelella alba]|uniref:Dephospho-CoA kinase n=1 Tax=Martelella alba TaxID=2590451 RepID=A0A506U755_9HYPH|nr:dephospho-CoA kinase [Martelella alba]TPW28449.1 dephospho-CoA kinase [Martelella alba]
MIILGLTGSIGMGKSTTARFFADQGVPVHDADQAVHDLYSGEAVAPVEQAFPGTAVDGAIDRARLSAALNGKAENFKRLEAIVHPLVLAKRKAFLEKAAATGADLAVLDIPLLFETGSDQAVDYVAVVTADADTQRVRVLERPGMTVEKFETILNRQMPDSEKRVRADFVIDTSQGMAAAQAAVAAIIENLRNKGRQAE